MSRFELKLVKGKALIIQGAPGSGKTRLAALLAELCKVPFRSISSSDLAKPFWGHQLTSEGIETLIIEEVDLSETRTLDSVMHLLKQDTLRVKKGGRYVRMPTPNLIITTTSTADLWHTLDDACFQVIEL